MRLKEKLYIRHDLSCLLMNSALSVNSRLNINMATTTITSMVVEDIRFPTSLEKDGSDAMVGVIIYNNND